MKYPHFLKDNATIALIATSCGSNKNPYRLRTQVGIKKFLKQGYKIKKGHRLFLNKNAVSGPHTLRASDFNKMYKNKNIDFIWSTGGGELMIGMLPYVDFDKIKKLPPKFFMGFSDNTNLTFTLTTICDIATIYGCSIGSFAYETLNEDTIDHYKLMKGEKLAFTSYKYFHGENSKVNDATPLTPLIYNDINIIQSLNNANEHFEGRIIGGCFDCILCLCGTKFDNVANFIEKYKNDGIIWYFDVCDLNTAALYRGLFQLKNASWFKYVKGFIFGRLLNKYEPLDYTLKQALSDALSDLNVPVIYDADISHISPKIPIINGSIATINYENNKLSISFTLK